MTLPVARSRDEAVLCLDLTPCSVCGLAEMEWEHSQAVLDGELVSCYAGVCACGAEREYFFGLPAQEVAGGFGGPEPSELLDAGQWMAVADELASHARRDDDQILALAAAAVAETLKFLPPAAEVVPADAFWTEHGRRVHAEQPGRFRRDRLMVVLATYSGVS